MATSIHEVSGIGPSTAAILAENGIASAEDLAAQTVRKLSTIKTFSQKRARKVIQAAKDVLPAPAPAVEEMKKPVEASATKGKKSKKNKKKKDKKKKGKKVKKDKKKDKSKKKKKGKGKKKKK